jgi:hypothetical protein
MPARLASGASPGTMTPMTGAAETSATPRSRDTELRISVALVTAVVVVHLVMAYFVDSIASAIIDLVEPLLGLEAARLAISLTAWLPLALVVLLRARARHLAWVACGVMAGVATLSYLRGLVLERLLDAGYQDAALSFLDWSTWALTSLIPLGAALAWGIARRRGTGWWPGLLVAVVVASLFRWLDIAAFADSDLRFAFAALVYHVVPALLAGLACWWYDAREAGP